MREGGGVPQKFCLCGPIDYFRKEFPVICFNIMYGGANLYKSFIPISDYIAHFVLSL